MIVDHNLRSILLELEKRLSDDDRNRLHFFLGNDVPRRIRDDASLRGTLSLMESLFDQDKINEQDFTLLIHAFDEIQCIDAAQVLREHMKRTQLNTVNQSIQSLASIMPSIEVDKYNILNFKSDLIDTEMISLNEISENVNQLNEEKSQKKSLIKFKNLLLLLLILILLISGLINLIINKFYQLKKEKLIKQFKYYQLIDNYTIVNLTNQLEELNKKNQEQYEIIQQLNNLRLSDKKTIEELNKRYSNIYLISTTTKSIHCNIDFPGCGCPCVSKCQNNCIIKFGGNDGRCTGFLNSSCECRIGDIWYSKAGQC